MLKVTSTLHLSSRDGSNATWQTSTSSTGWFLLEKKECKNSKPAQNEKYQKWYTIDAQDAILAILTLLPI